MATLLTESEPDDFINPGAEIVDVTRHFRQQKVQTMYKKNKYLPTF